MAVMSFGVFERDSNCEIVFMFSALQKNGEQKSYKNMIHRWHGGTEEETAPEIRNNGYSKNTILLFASVAFAFRVSFRRQCGVEFRVRRIYCDGNNDQTNERVHYLPINFILFWYSFGFLFSPNCHKNQCTKFRRKYFVWVSAKCREIMSPIY